MKRIFPEDALPDFVRLVHGNTNNKGFLAKEFSAFWSKKKIDSNPQDDKSKSDGSGTPVVPNSGIPKSKILERLQDVAKYERFEEAGPLQGRMCWVVKKEILEKLELTGKLNIPNDWKYVLEQPKRAVDVVKSANTSPQKKEEEKKKEKKRVSIQTLFMSMKSKEKVDEDEVKIIEPEDKKE